MTFRVDWLPDAERELTNIWLEAVDRDAVTTAADSIDRTLRVNPDDEGESRPDGRRILFVSPLAVLFRVLPNHDRVVVTHVWQY